MALSPNEMRAAIIRNLPEKTGKTLEDWTAVAGSYGTNKSTEIIQKLKSEHNLGHFQAQTIALHYLKKLG